MERLLKNIRRTSYGRWADSRKTRMYDNRAVSVTACVEEGVVVELNGGGEKVFGIAKRLISVFTENIQPQMWLVGESECGSSVCKLQISKPPIKSGVDLRWTFFHFCRAPVKLGHLEHV